MAVYKGTDAELTAVANAIRAKGGTSAQLEWPSGFVSAIEAIPVPSPGPEIVSWASGTDEQIVALIEAAHDGTIDLQQDAGWAVGDVRTIRVSEFTTPSSGGSKRHPEQDIDIVITSFDDYMNCGCVLQFDFKDAVCNDYSGTGSNVYCGDPMNDTSSCNGGYTGNSTYPDRSRMYRYVIPSLVDALPAWLKNILISFSLVSCNEWYDSSLVTSSGHKLALRSEYEVFGESTRSKVAEGSQISYYSTSANRIKKIGHDNSVSERSGNAGIWWLRSMDKSYTSGSYAQKMFCCVDSSGNDYGQGASGTNGLAPFGCL